MWKRKKKETREHVKTNEEAFLNATSSSPLWNGLVVHHKDVFVSHVISKLNTTDRFLFSEVNTESRDVLKYAGVNASGLPYAVPQCSSISTLEWMWNHVPWGMKLKSGRVKDQACFAWELLERTNSSFSSGREK